MSLSSQKYAPFSERAAERQAAMLPDLSGLLTAGGAEVPDVPGLPAIPAVVADLIVDGVFRELVVDVSVVPFGTRTLTTIPSENEVNGIRCEVRTNWEALRRRASAANVARELQLTLQSFAEVLSRRIATFVVDRLEQRPGSPGKPSIERHKLMDALYYTSDLPQYTHSGAPGVTLNAWTSPPSPGCNNYDVAVARDGRNLNAIPVGDALAICVQARAQLQPEWIADSYAEAEASVRCGYLSPAFVKPPTPTDWVSVPDPVPQRHTSRYEASLRAATKKAVLKKLAKEGAARAGSRDGPPPHKRAAPFAGDR